MTLSPLRQLLIFLIMAFSLPVLAGRVSYTVGIDSDNAPYEFLSPRGKPLGINVDILRAVAKRGRMKFIFVSDSRDSLQSHFQTGEIDILGSMTKTPANQNKYLFSVPYAYVHYAAFVRKGCPEVNSWDDLNGRQVLLKADDMIEEILLARAPGAKILKMADNLTALESLSDGCGTVVVLPRIQGYYLCSENKLENLKASGNLGYAIPECLAVAPNQADLRTDLNICIQNLQFNQSLRYIQQKWLGVFEQQDSPYVHKRRFFAVLIMGLCLSFGVILVLHHLLGKRIKRQHRFMEQQKTERNSLEREIRLRHHLFLTGPIVFMKWGDREKEVFEYISENFAAFGYDPEAILSSTIPYRHIIHPDDLEWILADRRKHLEEGSFSYAQIYRIICPVQDDPEKDNLFVNTWHELNPELARVNTVQIRYLFDYTFYVPDEITKTNYFYGYLLDITNLKLYERELLRQQQAAQVAIHTKDAFLTRITAEINSPLNALIGLVRKLTETGLSEEQDSIAQTISISALKLKRILQQIHDFLSILKGSIGSEPQWQILKHLMEPIVSEYQAFAAKKQLTFTYQESNPTQQVFLDRDWFQKIVRIVMDNAIKFTRHGRIEVAVEVVETESGKQMLQVRIADTGIGIPQNMLHLILEPFTQVDETFTRNYGGIGLGLSIARNLLLQMDGELYIASTEGLGTTVDIQFPVQVKTK